MSNTHKVKVLEEAFYKGGIRPVNSVIDYEGDTIPSWATLADGQASTVQGNFKIENPTPPKVTGKQAARSNNKNNKIPQTVIKIADLPDDKKAELALKANEAGITEDISLLTVETLNAEIAKRGEEKQIARLEELKTLAIEKNIPFEQTEAPIDELIKELEEKINTFEGVKAE